MKKILDYFHTKYEDNEFVINTIKQKSDDELRKIYKNNIIREDREKSILENGTTTYTIDFDYDLRKEVTEYMLNNNMFTIFNGTIEYRHGNDGRLIGVPIEFIEILKAKFKLELSREMKVLGRKDLEGFQIGDKATIVMSGAFGNSQQQGTVHDITENTITIRKYRSRSKGYILRIGEECSITKIKKFEKVS